MNGSADNQADAVLLMSIYKPLVVMAAVWGWTWLAGKIDQDVNQHFAQRKSLINAVHLSLGAAGFGCWLIAPWFWVGLGLGGGFAIAPVLGYARYRNRRVSKAQRWRTPWVRWWVRRAKKAQARSPGGPELKLIGADQNELDPAKLNGSRIGAHQLLAKIVAYALPRGADGFEVVVGPGQPRIEVRIDGVRYPWPKGDLSLAIALIDYLKEQAGLDLADRRRRLKGTVGFKVANSDPHRLKMTTWGSTRGFALSAELDPQAKPLHDLAALGFSQTQRARIDEVLGPKKYLVLVSCPPDQGQSQVLYGLLGRHDPYTQSVVALEHETRWELDGVHHQSLSEYLNGDELSQQVESALMYGADVLLLDRLEDRRCARQLAGVATDIRVYAGFEGPETLAVLKSWLELVGDNRLAGACLGAIICGRRVRKLCPNCRQPYRPDQGIIKKLNLPAERVGMLYRHSGQIRNKGRLTPCPNCLGLGYKGREGVFEVMVFDDHARQLVVEEPLDRLRAYVRKQKMLWLQEAALAKAFDGITSIREITRVLSLIDGSLPKGAVRGLESPRG